MAIDLGMTRATGPVRCFLGWVHGDDYPALAQAASAHLHPQEHDYFLGTRHERRRRSFLMGRAAAKQAIAAYLGGADPTEILVRRGCFDQPVVCHPSFDVPLVSITHHESLALAVACDPGHVVGIDVEGIERADTSVFERVLTAKERRRIDDLFQDGHLASVLLWCIKEALSKALRVGMMTPFELLSVRDLQVFGTTLKVLFDHFAQYRAVAWKCDQLAVGLVLPRKTEFKLDLAQVLRNNGG
ncbi:MAG: hypothetical protein A2284_13825 [Deltaproteobacteria bacterium RIFOXYA12_FULL_61_11]|nr:MAG: hypothetical protein A2284_13825 [Deltaproteobacteria bacterium RIFOXYA12_FULL_61_11]